MKNKKILSAVLCLIFIILSMSVAFSAFANDVDWRYDDKSKTIYIFGSGDMNNYENEYSVQWSSYIDLIEAVVIEDGVTSVGAYSFSGASNLVKVTLADSVVSMGTSAFSSCPKLLSLDFGENITKIFDSSYAYNGTVKKSGFVLNVKPATYALSYAVDNKIAFNCSSVKCGSYKNKIYPAGMTAYYPYSPRVDGIFKFYSKSSQDTIGTIYDADFNELASNDDYNGSDFYFEYNLKKNQIYYVALNLFSEYIAGSYEIYIEPVSYTADVSIYAMKSPKGEPSSILLDGAVVDGKITNGTVTLQITQQSQSVTVTYEYASKQFILSPDKDTVLSLMVCDLNNDGAVNGIDYAMMKKSSSPFLPLFQNLAGYSY